MTAAARWVSHEEHRIELERSSGVRAEIAAAAGLWSESDPSVLSKLTGRPKKAWTSEHVPALVFPYFVPSESDPVLFNVKPRRPLANEKDGAIELLKYVRSPLPIRLYFPPGLHASERQRRDTSRALLITEGEKKALSAESHGLLCIGLTGVTCWSVRRGRRRVLHPDFEHFDLRGRRVFVIFDSDAIVNILNVRREEKELAKALLAAGAHVHVVRLPDADDGSKQGLDDVLVARGRTELERLCNAARQIVSTTQAGVAAPEYATDLTDAGNAERLAKMHGQDLRYLPARKGWLTWDGRRWCAIAEEEVIALALNVVASIFEEAAAAGKRGDTERSTELQKHATRSRSAAGLANMVRVARALPGITIRPEQLDADPWLFCCANGVLDLHTLELRPHERDLLLTKVSTVRYDPAARSAKWDAFIAHLANGREGYADFLQTVAGYALCGDTSEEKFVLMTGEGGAGKGTWADALRAVLGDYAAVADFDTFMRQERSGGAAPTEDLARLAGTRAVFASESEDGKRMSEARVKSITGGDTIAASFKYGHIFEFRPQFKLFLASNYPPAVREDDSGLWRRMLHVPFDQPPARPDPDLKARFRDAERDASAVLNWMVAGFQMWLRRRIVVPECVRVSTESYRADQDLLADFFAEKCVLKRSAAVPTHDLKVAYKEWRNETGERYAPGWKRVCERLRQAGCESKPGFYRGKRKRLWIGVGLAADDELEAFQDDAGETEHKTQNRHCAPTFFGSAHAREELGEEMSFLCSVLQPEPKTSIPPDQPEPARRF